MAEGQGRTKYAQYVGLRIGSGKLSEKHSSMAVAVPTRGPPSKPQPAHELRAGRVRSAWARQLQPTERPRPPTCTEPMRLLHTEDAVMTGEQRQRLVLDGDVSDVRHRNRHGFAAETDTLVPVEQRPYV